MTSIATRVAIGIAATIVVLFLILGTPDEVGAPANSPDAMVGRGP